MLMTTGAIVFSLALLLFASGVDAASRFGLGLVIASGMLTGTLFTMFVLPTVYVWLARDCAVATACQSEVPFHQLNAVHTTSFAVVVVYFFVLRSARHVALFIKHQNQST